MAQTALLRMALAILPFISAMCYAQEPTKTLISEGLFGSKSGNEKKEAALSFVGAALSITEAISERQIVDEGKFREGLGKIIDGTVQCLNASVWAKAQ